MNQTDLQKSARGRPRTGETERRWRHILDVATLVLLRDGYSSTSIAQIAREAGVSKKTIYAKYENKAVLTRELSLHVFQQHWKRFEQRSQDENRDLVSLLTDYAITLAGAWCSQRGAAMYRILVTEVPNSKELAEVYNGVQARREAFLAAIFRRFMERGQILRADPRVLARLFVHLAVGDLRERALLGHRVRKADIKAAADLAVEILLRAYAANNASARFGRRLR